MSFIDDDFALRAGTTDGTPRPEYASVADMEADIGSGISDGDPAYVTDESAWYVVDGSNATLLADSVGSGPLGLTADQFSNQDLFFATWCDPRLMQVAVAGTDDSQNWLSPADTLATNGDNIRGLIDAGVNTDPLINSNDAVRPSFNTSPTSDATQAVTFDGSEALEWIHSDNEADAFKFLWDDSSDFTIILRASFNSDPASAGEMAWLGSLFGTVGGQFTLMHLGSNDLGYFVKNGSGSTQSVQAAFAGFSTNTLYTMAVRHTAGGDTELFIDDLATPAATDTITSWNTKDGANRISLGARAGNQAYADGDFVGLAICRSALTQAQMEAWDTKFKAEGG